MPVSATEEPATLQNLCIGYIANKIGPQAANDGAACHKESSDSAVLQKSWQSLNRTFIHSAVADLLISQMSTCRTLCNETVKLFQSSTTCLRHVVIRRAPVTAAGLRVLRAHKLVSLAVEPDDPKQLTVTDIIRCLNEWTVANLRSLSVTGVTFGQVGAPPVIVSLCALRNLRSLDVSRTDFNDSMLKIIVDDLPLLESIDISSTLVRDVTSLSRCRTRLRRLLMYNIRLQDASSADVLRSMSALQVLDLSQNSQSTSFTSLTTNSVTAEDIIQEGSEFHDLVSLDISGTENVDVNLVRKFIASHKQLEFVGLLMTGITTSHLSDLSAVHRPNITIAEETTEDALLRSLCRYSTRHLYMHRCFRELFSKTQEYTQARPDIIKLILPVMRQHWNDHRVLLPATACLYHLVRNDLSKKMSTRLLAGMVELLLHVFETAPSQSKLQAVKNCLFILCNDHILQEVNFDRYHCCQLVLECLCQYDDASVIQMSIAICGILAAKISTSQTSCLGSDRRYMQKFLSIIDSRINSRIIDTTLKFTLSALWNLSDEAPLTCEAFVAEGGMQIFLRVLETFESEQPVQRASLEVKLLGFLNNLAEVKKLKKILAEEEVLLKIRELLHSSQLDVSYFAGGIVSHLLADESTRHMLSATVVCELCDELEEVVQRWEQPDQEMVAYRSFGPFFPLLGDTADSAVQLWALWALQHVCNLNGDRYCSLLVDEGGVEFIQRIRSSPTTNPRAVEIASDVLHMVSAKFPKSVDSV